MNADQNPPEEKVSNAEDAAIDKDVMDTPLAMTVSNLFTGRVGRRWKVGEIERELKGLGFSVSRNSVMLALGELEAHLEDNLFLPGSLWSVPMNGF
jgi:hypothetical protein